MDLNWSVYVTALTAAVLRAEREEAGLPSAQGVLRFGWTETQWTLLGWRGDDRWAVIELGNWN